MPESELSGRGRIVVSAKRDGKDIVIDVVDNGIGLPKENRAKLLEPYVTTREKGTGLGLAIVERIMEEHGGDLQLTDGAQLPGAKVSLRLPFVITHAAADAPSAAAAALKDA